MAVSAIGAVAALVAIGLSAAAAQDTAMVAPPGAGYRLNDRTLVLTYDVYIGGLHAFRFDATVGVDDRSYEVALDGGTSGVIGRLFSWRASLRSDGAVASTQPVPAGLSAARFESATAWQGKPRRTSLTFTGDGRYDVALEPPEDADSVREDGGLPSILPPGTMDPVAASLAALSASARDGACARRLPVFDGKRYYELIVRDGDGDNVVPPSHLSAFSGPALKCRIAMRRLAGFSKRRYAQYWDDESSDLPTIWSAALAPGMPLVPVRFLAPIHIAGNLGTMVIHIVHAELRAGAGTRVLVDQPRAR
ncbi:MAG: DUF3108 domain-containing protein [Gemmatimonas sp.]